ncbi:MFS transporter [Luteipulveratus mongoliensis]|uniref:Major facilitator superfamily (MFS) profile domain-containing protein n=1 Tax=Luteipulveratus mongoliensis TaxID=571913 RepID=A0A0K1JDW0_9MICO|nr:MFS transporter [Luteipulveratus mongoliensis]AKU14778.1 hypothetical protein VV02_00950 [Luteipulveratus mongoliensis]
MTTGTAVGGADVVPPDRQMVRALWPLLVAAALGLVPFTVFSTFLVPIASDAGSDIDVVGALRGLGGLAALAVGALAAPVVDRLSRAHIAAGALALLAAGCLLSLASSTATWVVFSLLIGAGTSLLNPALSVMAADHYAGAAASGRAATLVSSTTTLTAVLAAPLLAVPALWWGWQGDFVVAAVACVVVAALVVRRPAPIVEPSAAVGYREAFRTVLSLPGVPGLLLISAARTTCFMGQLAYVAAYFDDRHGLSATTFSLVWTLSGLSFFLGSWWTGRHLSRSGDAGTLLRRGCALGAVGAATLFMSPSLIVALVAVSAVAAGHAMIAATVVTLVVRRAGRVRGTALSLNASGQSLGVFLGAALVALALRLGGWHAVGGTLAVIMAGALLMAMRLRDSSHEEPT